MVPIIGVRGQPVQPVHLRYKMNRIFWVVRSMTKKIILITLESKLHLV